MSTGNYTRRDFLKAIGLGTAALTMPGCVTSAGQASGRSSVDKPNFVIIFMDDQGYADVGCFGAKGLETPNLTCLLYTSPSPRDRS